MTKLCSHTLQLLLTFNNGGGTTAVEYNREGVNFCDGNWYEVEMLKSGVIGHLIVNGTDIEMTSSAFSTFTTVNSAEPLFIGGIPSELTTILSHKRASNLFY